MLCVRRRHAGMGFKYRLKRGKSSVRTYMNRHSQGDASASNPESKDSPLWNCTSSNDADYQDFSSSSGTQYSSSR